MIFRREEGRWRARSVRIGMWKERVSAAQRRRKKRYWARMGCVARKVGD
jgi:hypothetical protein